MTLGRVNAALYWAAIVVFAVGVAMLVVAETVPVSSLEHPGEVVLVAAWGLAATGAAVDLVRHRRHPPTD